ncbi:MULTISPECIES: alpha/beta fold hydrolase [Aerococcus]|uniref:alpha/beta fold hydrolase n=1 Tax=Aerococcus TaxID=1375 RepID=UPI0018A7163A|nr:MULTISPECIES: alpha/beta hydrolase [Aerococcus]MCY3036313.1 alpha/beta hydrolase [Aerococcus sp. Group 2]MCY3039654.1 alpha/beta hydrolase [Aerococcus sp. Group 2]MCY3041861.1 alpha/beta hydrolase [Aerococcus sp. Group 2]MCY3043110.1 alpha/beta hydrolase [Aerococcus sp. Group 2]MDK6520326.1 alpha/beta hydrolase [Aerococcus urinae]
MKNILIHGLGQDRSSWDQVKKYLDEESVTVQCPNLYELFENDPYTYQTLYQNFERQVNNYPGKVNLCGLSLGGLLALDYAKNYPEKVNSLILIGLPYKIPKLLMTIQAMVFKLMPESNFTQLGLGKDEFISLIASTKDLSIATHLEEITCKTLLICGEKDRFNLTSSQRFHTAIKNSEFSLVNNSGHEVNVDNPQVLAQLIAGFWKN